MSQFTVAGSAISIIDDLSMRDEWIAENVQRYREERASRRKASNVMPIPASLSVLGNEAEDVDDQVRDFETRVRAAWPDGLDTLIVASAERVTFTIQNRGSFLKSPQIIVTIPNARALEAVSPADVDLDEVLPPVVDSRLLKGRLGNSAYRPASNDLDWNQRGDTLQIFLTPEALRPETPWTLDEDRLVIYATGQAKERLELTWSLTAEGINRPFSGKARIPIQRFESPWEMMIGLADEWKSHR